MIRRATLADIPAIASISRAAREAAMPWLPSLHSPEEDLHFFEHHVVPQNDVVVVEVDDDVVGFMACDADWMEHLYIHPNHQSKGLGAAFIVHAQSQVTALQLWIFAQNKAARKFYADHGFVEVERTDGHRNAEKCPDIRMRWEKPTPVRTPIADGIT